MNKAGERGFDNWSWITERLATGGGPVTSDDVDFLIKNGITHMIDCRVTPDPVSNPEHTATMKSVRASLSAVAIRYLYNPTEDDGQPKPTSWFLTSMNFALPALFAWPGNQRGKVYAHCDQGINRGPSTAYCILRALTGLSHDDAKSIIILHRPVDVVGIRYADDADKALKEMGYVL